LLIVNPSALSYLWFDSKVVIFFPSLFHDSNVPLRPCFPVGTAIFSVLSYLSGIKIRVYKYLIKMTEKMQSGCYFNKVQQLQNHDGHCSIVHVRHETLHGHGPQIPGCHGQYLTPSP